MDIRQYEAFKKEIAIPNRIVKFCYKCKYMIDLSCILVWRLSTLYLWRLEKGMMVTDNLDGSNGKTLIAGEIEPMEDMKKLVNFFGSAINGNWNSGWNECRK